MIDGDRKLELVAEGYCSILSGSYILQGGRRTVGILTESFGRHGQWRHLLRVGKVNRLMLCASLFTVLTGHPQILQ